MTCRNLQIFKGWSAFGYPGCQRFFFFASRERRKGESAMLAGSLLLTVRPKEKGKKIPLVPRVGPQGRPPG